MLLLKQQQKRRRNHPLPRRVAPMPPRPMRRPPLLARKQKRSLLRPPPPAMATAVHASSGTCSPSRSESSPTSSTQRRNPKSEIRSSSCVSLQRGNLHAAFEREKLITPSNYFSKAVNPACRGKRKCARACRCPDDEQETALAALCRLAIDPLDDAVDPVRPSTQRPPLPTDSLTDS